VSACSWKGARVVCFGFCRLRCLPWLGERLDAIWCMQVTRHSGELMREALGRLPAPVATLPPAPDPQPLPLLPPLLPPLLFPCRESAEVVSMSVQELAESLMVRAAGGNEEVQVWVGRGGVGWGTHAVTIHGDVWEEGDGVQAHAARLVQRPARLPALPS